MFLYVCKLDRKHTGNPSMHFDPNQSAYLQAAQSFKGPIPPHIKAAAFAIDRERERKRARLRVDKLFMKPETIIDLMALIIANCVAAFGGVTLEDFKRHGLTESQVHTFWHRALRHAQAECRWLTDLEKEPGT